MTSSDTVSTLLVCAISGERLQLLNDDDVSRLNRRLSAGTSRLRGGQPAPTVVQGGLLSRRAGVVYPIVDDLPRLLPEDALDVRGCEEIVRGARGREARGSGTAGVLDVHRG